MRFECKFLIPDAETYMMLKMKMDFLFPRDAFCLKKEYNVHSLYFDTEDLDFFLQKIEGEYVHEKLRVRSYCDQRTKSYLERKSKRGDLQFKKRVKISTNWRDDLFQLFPQKRTFPVLNVSFQRLAWVDGPHRYTLDHSIGPYLQDSPIIFEVKTADYKVSSLMTSILKKLKLQRISFSKYSYVFENFKLKAEWKEWEEVLH